MPPRKRLGQLLTELKVIDEHQLQSALGHQKQWGGKLGVILVQKGFCNEEQVVAALSQHLGMPVVRLSEVKIEPGAVKKVSRSVAERLHVFAYEVTGAGRSEVITIAMSDPTDLSAIDQLAFHTGKRIKPMLAGDSEVLAAIQQHYGASQTPAAGVQPLPAGGRPFMEGSPAGVAGRPTPVAPIAPVPPAANPTPGFSKRVEPSRPTPSMVQPVPAAEPPSGIGGVDGNGALAPAEPVALGSEDLPADAPVEGLEPIAAHTQGDESVEGAEEVSGEGTAADEVIGLQAANPPLEDGSGASQAEGSYQSASAEGDWDRTAELPADAILGSAETGEPAPAGDAQAADAPEAWSDIADPLGAPAAEDGGMQESAWAAAAAEVEAAAGESSPEGGESLLEPPGDSSEPAEEVAIEAEWSEEEVSVADEAPSDAATAEDMPFEMEADAGTADDFSTTTARQGWISRAASLGEDQVGEVPPGTAEEEGAPAGQEYSEEAPAESGYAEADAPVEAGQDESGSYATEEELPAGSEGWVAVQEEQPQDAGWAEEAVSYTPLSPADLRTLDALGLDPSDAAAAQRMLACLVRVLNRRQAIDVDELAAEIRESRLAGEAAAQAQPEEQPALGEPGADEMGASEEGAQTSGSGQDP